MMSHHSAAFNIGRDAFSVEISFTYEEDEKYLSVRCNDCRSEGIVQQALGELWERMLASEGVIANTLHFVDAEKPELTFCCKQKAVGTIVGEIKESMEDIYADLHSQPPLPSNDYEDRPKWPPENRIGRWVDDMDGPGGPNDDRDGFKRG